MATWNTKTQTGGPQRWIVWGGNITNHEAFAFTLQSAGHNVGALISDVAVYVDQANSGGEPSYNITLNAVDQFANPVDQGITGNFESNGVRRGTMKVNLVKDANGKVVATFENAVAGGPSVKPVLKPGQKMHEVDAAENYKSDIKAFYKHHRR